MTQILQDLALMATIVLCAVAIGYVGAHLRASRKPKIGEDARDKAIDPAIDYRRVKFSAGTTLKCPEEGCGVIIAVANTGIRSGDTALSNAWTWFNPHRTQGGRPTFECGTCRALFARSVGGRHELHTTKGWVG